MKADDVAGRYSGDGVAVNVGGDDFLDALKEEAGDDTVLDTLIEEAGVDPNDRQARSEARIAFLRMFSRATMEDATEVEIRALRIFVGQFLTEEEWQDLLARIRTRDQAGSRTARLRARDRR